MLSSMLESLSVLKNPLALAMWSFRGNNLVISMGLFKKGITLSQAVRLWVVCYIGNWLGSILIAVTFFGAGFAVGSVGEFIASTSVTKMSLPFFQLFLRGILCNILVCLATWCSFRCRSESGKLIMIFWCLFAFITSSYEHSIANMSLLTVSLLAPFDMAISLSGYFYNILVVTLGNIVGGIVFVSLPYYLISLKRD